MKYVFLSLAVMFNISAYMIFKSISNEQNNLQWLILFLTGLLLAGINTFFFTKSLKEMNLGTAYPVFSAASITFIVFLSVWIFHEKMNAVNILGAFVTIIGIVLLTR